MVERIQRKRTKGWKMPPNTVVVSRPSKWGNPFDFRSSEHCWVALSFGCRADPAGRHEASVRAFRQWIDAPAGKRTASMSLEPKMVGPGGEMALGPRVEVGAAPSLVEIREALAGKNLACWCALSKPCHGEVLLELANRDA